MGEGRELFHLTLGQGAMHAVLWWGNWVYSFSAHNGRVREEGGR